ncbi:hypothetical protein C8R46DRAFT_1186869 [Mycena filopes]|nr:hypothetical protein C8R46DRAFT_1186869 [Mycena filopes]
MGRPEFCPPLAPSRYCILRIVLPPVPHRIGGIERCYFVLSATSGLMFGGSVQPTPTPLALFFHVPAPNETRIWTTFTIFILGVKASGSMPIVVTNETFVGQIYAHLASQSIVPRVPPEYLYFTHGRRSLGWGQTMGELGLGPLSHLCLRMAVPGGSDFNNDNHSSNFDGTTFDEAVSRDTRSHTQRERERLRATHTSRDVRDARLREQRHDDWPMYGGVGTGVPPRGKLKTSSSHPAREREAAKAAARERREREIERWAEQVEVMHASRLDERDARRERYRPRCGGPERRGEARCADAIRSVGANGRSAISQQSQSDETSVVLGPQEHQVWKSRPLRLQFGSEGKKGIVVIQSKFWASMAASSAEKSPKVTEMARSTQKPPRPLSEVTKILPLSRTSVGVDELGTGTAYDRGGSFVFVWLAGSVGSNFENAKAFYRGPREKKGGLNKFIPAQGRTVTYVTSVTNCTFNQFRVTMHATELLKRPIYEEYSLMSVQDFTESSRPLWSFGPELPDRKDATNTNYLRNTGANKVCVRNPEQQGTWKITSLVGTNKDKAAAAIIGSAGSLLPGAFMVQTHSMQYLTSETRLSGSSSSATIGRPRLLRCPDDRVQHLDISVELRQEVNIRGFPCFRPSPSQMSKSAVGPLSHSAPPHVPQQLSECIQRASRIEIADWNE